MVYNVYGTARPKIAGAVRHCKLIASFPGSPPREHVYCVTFDPHKKSGGEPGEFYHVSDVKGREEVERT